MEKSNGHCPEETQLIGGTNVYADMARGERPEELVQFERDTDPYANMLPGISSIRAAQTVGRGVKVGRRGNRLILVVSLLMLTAIVLPLIVAIISQLGH